MKALATAALCLVTVAGCGGDPTQEAALRAQAARPVTCNGDHDCFVKWGRAVQWAVGHSSRIRSAGFWEVKTEQSSKSERPIFTIMRVVNPDGSNTFELDAGCPRWFGCDPTVLAEKASFAQYVMGPQ